MDKDEMIQMARNAGIPQDVLDKAESHSLGVFAALKSGQPELVEAALAAMRKMLDRVGIQDPEASVMIAYAVVKTLDDEQRITKLNELAAILEVSFLFDAGGVDIYCGGSQSMRLQGEDFVNLKLETTKFRNTMSQKGVDIGEHEAIKAGIMYSYLSQVSKDGYERVRDEALQMLKEKAGK